MGGVHPPGNKLSSAAKCVRMPLPSMVTVPLSQHTGAPAAAVVARGARVKTGQLIAEKADFISANVHSPVTGIVVSVGTFIDASGFGRPGITISAEPDEWDENIESGSRVVRECTLEPSDIIKKVTDAGVVGMGGAVFPTAVKLSVPRGSEVGYLLINGAECEPYLTTDHRIMLERGEELLIGVRILAKALGTEKAFVCIEDDKPDAIESLARIGAIVAPEIGVIPLKVKYPQGCEKQLIEAATGRRVPSGKLPVDVGVVVHNVGTALAVYEAVQKNKPLIERVVTVTGKDMESPRNVIVRIGTSIRELIDFCGGLPEGTGKVIAGGPMMGRAIYNLDSPVTKGTGGIVLMRGGESLRSAAGQCIRCGRCVTVCPMGLEPYLLSKVSEKGLWEDAEAHYITDCMECGSCAYECPAALPLLDYIRLGKSEVLKMTLARKS